VRIVVLQHAGSNNNDKRHKGIIMMDRRAFLKRSAGLAGVAVAGAPLVESQAQSRVITLTISGISPPDNPNSVVFKRYLDNLSTAAGGRLKLNWHPGGVLVPSNQALDATGQGTVDMILSQPSYYSGKVGLGSYTELPFFSPSYKAAADSFYNTAIHKIIDDVYREKTNTTVIQTRPFPPYVFIMNRNKPIRSLTDISGKKIRTPGGMVDEIVKALGGVPVKLVPGEFYQAMQQGIVDGFLLPLYSLDTYKLGDFKPIVTAPGPGSLTTQFVWMNLDRWNQLPADLQALIKSTTLAEIGSMDTFWKGEDDKALAYARKVNVDIIQLSKADQQAMPQKARGIIDVFAKREGDRGAQLVKLLEAL
jgi:TRAP-type C4-dicarboxylate transport system substrate-binding protein